MRLLITGGAGFIGTNFVRYVLSTDPQVRVTVLDAFTYAARGDNLAYLRERGEVAWGPNAADAGARLEVVRGSITDQGLVDQLVAEHDVVVHLAAESHNDNSLANPKTFVDTNLVGTFHILQAVLKHNRRLHHVSTDEVYGDLPLGGKEKFTEESAYKPSSPYSATKAGSDLLVQAWIRSFGLRATISSCSNNYGPFQHVEKFIPRQITNLIDGVRPRLYGTGANVRDWIHVLDHCSALWLILQRGVIGRTYLVGADAERSNLQMVGRILSEFGRGPDDYDLVADRAGHDLRYAIDASRITAELGWRPEFTDLGAGVAQTVAWYRTNEQWWRPAKNETEQAYLRAGH
ncbi:dTDP-glucose 4,6-dehydratase [Jonesiaceae bacterium BS-20]|uniref:dTDP-glucose 4,6-dehydratase n=1 Tax=Jonesiaceae bacterium BS-20 TaxID=3120821 RepID=A0AAU7DZH8_9MICO